MYTKEKRVVWNVVLLKSVFIETNVFNVPFIYGICIVYRRKWLTAICDMCVLHCWECNLW